MWFYVWARRNAGEHAQLLSQPGMDQWLQEFPQLSELTLTRDAVRFTDKRMVTWNQKFADFDPKELEGFIHDVLLSSESFRTRIERSRNVMNDNDVVINIRRGDYYSNPDHALIYGMDQVYLLSLVREYLGDLSSSTVWAVSDDLEWSLQFLSERVPGARVRPVVRAGMFDDLAALVSAPTLVLSNSTFSYWGGYARTVATGGPERVLVPTFHLRRPDWGRAWQADPAWTAVDNYPYEIARDPLRDAEGH